MKVHELKTHPDPFRAVWDGRKLAEFRRHDRDFKVNDYLHLREWIPGEQSYTGRWILAVVTDIRGGGPPLGVPDGFCMMSIFVKDIGTDRWDQNSGS